MIDTASAVDLIDLWLEVCDDAEAIYWRLPEDVREWIEENADPDTEFRLAVCRLANFSLAARHLMTDTLGIARDCLAALSEKGE